MVVNGTNARTNNPHVTTSQIKVAQGTDAGKCLKFTTLQGLYLEACNVDPIECFYHRCFYSANLGYELWYLSAFGQLIASYTHTHIPPLALATDQTQPRSNAFFSGPFPGLAEYPGNRRCGKVDGGKDTTSALCKNTTVDGKLFVSLQEMEARCAADSTCAGFAQDTKDGPSYFRPLWTVKSLLRDPKWTTWTKGARPPTPSPSPPPPSPNDWFDSVDVPYCLATSPSTSPPKEPSKPPEFSGRWCTGVFAGPLANGTIAVGLVNRCNTSVAEQVTAYWAEIGAKAGTTYGVRDLFAHADLASASGQVTATVASHDMAILKLTPK